MRCFTNDRISSGWPTIQGYQVVSAWPQSGLRARTGAITILRNHEPCYRSTCQRQACANQHDHSESKYKCLRNGFLDGGFRTGIETSGHLQSSELDLVRLNLLNNVARQREVSQASIQARGEGASHRS